MTYPILDKSYYISSVQSLALRLGKSDKEMMAAFVRGLPGHLRVQIIQKNPQTYEEATKYARLCQEAITFTSPGQFNSVIPVELQQHMDRQQKSIDALTKIVSDITAQSAVSLEVSKVCAAGGQQKERPRIICQYCNKPNHTAKDCRKIKRDHEVKSPKQPQKCDFCYMTNHSTRDCRKLRAEIEKELK